MGLALFLLVVWLGVGFVVARLVAWALGRFDSHTQGRT